MMKVKTIFVHLKDEGKPTETYTANADIIVPGLGEVKTECALSDETIERIRSECLSALRVKLGQKLV